MQDVLKKEYCFTPEIISCGSKLVDSIEQWKGTRDINQSVAQGMDQSITHDLGHELRFGVVCADRKLQICGTVTAPEGWDFTANPDIPEWYLKDHVVLFFSPGNQFHLRRQVAFTKSKELQLLDEMVFDGEEYSDNLRKPIPLSVIQPQLDIVTETTGSWSFLITISLDELLGPDTSSDLTDIPLGFMLALGLEGEVEYAAKKWPAAANHYPHKNSPFCFGQIIPESANFEISKIDFAHPEWATGDIVSTVRIDGTQRKHTHEEIELHTIIQASDGELTTSINTLPIDGDFSISVPVAYPFASKWAPDLLETATVTLRMISHGKVSWEACFPFGFDCGLIVREPYASLSGQSIARPESDAAEFLSSYRAWIFSKLPNWSYQTTRDQAPSDFYLKGATADSSFNLMDDDIFAQFARYIHAHFTGWQDGFYAVAALLHHPYLTRHSASWARLTGASTPETILRYRGCFCSDTSRIAAQLIEELAPLYGIAAKAYSLGLRGHLLTLVETPIGAVLIDPMLGVSWFSEDKTRLATLDELKENLSLQKESWARASNAGREYIYKNTIMRLATWKKGCMEYP